MSLDDLKLIYIFSCFTLGIIILSPTLIMITKLPGGERFTELWILGPEHMAENYPFNIVSRHVYNISLGIANHMGNLEYYMVYVKLRSQNEPLPNSTSGMSSNLDPLFEYRVYIRDGEVWERPISFSLEFSHHNDFCSVSKLVIDGYPLNVNKTALWDVENKGYYLTLFFELWIYNSDNSSFQFHSRFVSLWLNLTQAL